MRFDEIELQAVPLVEQLPSQPSVAVPPQPGEAPRLRRLLALLTDLSLFAALALALTPLLPVAPNPVASLALAGFLVLVSYYYFVGAWLLWGKTVGGAIFDVRVVAGRRSPMSLKAATLRWIGIYFSLLTGGIGFALAALPSRLSFSDRLSQTRCVVAP
ncbi:MAG TPA: RDD family protein [Thermoanaerobaculia bacterium]|nr:RDD family protein [Thermoanaerobaculia bacterium]